MIKFTQAFLIMLYVANVNAESTEDVDLLVSYIKKSDFVQSSNIELVNVKGRKYLISIGKSSIKDDSPKSMLNAIRVSKLQAENEAIKFFVGSRLAVKETLLDTTSNNVSTSDYVVEQRERTSSNVEQYIYLHDWIVDRIHHTAIAYKIETD
jgi:hypothetical protein